MTDLKVGDKVRLTAEVVITGIDFDGEVEFDSQSISGSFYPEDLTGELEVIVPPFKVGEVVAEAEYRFLLLEDLGDGEYRYLSLQTHNVNTARFTHDIYSVVARITEEAA